MLLCSSGAQDQRGACSLALERLKLLRRLCRQSRELAHSAPANNGSPDACSPGHQLQAKMRACLRGLPSRGSDTGSTERQLDGYCTGQYHLCTVGPGTAGEYSPFNKRSKYTETNTWVVSGSGKPWPCRGLRTEDRQFYKCCCVAREIASYGLDGRVPQHLSSYWHGP
jgi:hypothetical protein